MQSPSFLPPSPLKRALSLTLIILAVAVLSTVPTGKAHAWEWSGWGKSVSGTGVIKTETRNVSGFTSVSLSLPAKVTLIQGTTEGLRIETDDNLLPLVETVVEGGKLRIRSADKTNLKTKTLNITVNLINLNGVSIAGSGEIIADRIKTEKFSSSISGSGDVKIAMLEATTVKASIAGSGDFTAAGKVGELDVSVAGSGDVRAGKLEAGKVRVSIAGSGDVSVWARDELKTSIAGSGDIRYYGQPTVKSSKAGSGSVKSMGNAP
jgi:hypothetical protein